jgi:hypothetical protein
MMAQEHHPPRNVGSPARASDQDRLSACHAHDVQLRRILDSDVDLDNDAISIIEEVIGCLACRWVVAQASGDTGWLDLDLGLTGRNGSGVTELRATDGALADNSSVGEPQLERVSTLSIVNTGRVETRILNMKQTVQLTSVFAPEARARKLKPGANTTFTGVFHSRQGEGRLPSRAVDELCYIHMHGALSLHYDGGLPIRLDAARGTQVMWLPAHHATGRGTPPATIVTETASAGGFVVYFRDSGVHWQALDEMDRIEPGVNDVDWTQEIEDDYWSDPLLLAPGEGGPRRQPFVASIPAEPAALAALFASGRLPSRLSSDPHHSARDAEQIDYATLPGWPTSPKHELARARRRLNRKRPVLDFRLLKLPGQKTRVDKGDVWVAQHPEGYEVVIPLIGGIRCIGGQVDRDELPSLDAVAFHPNEEQVDTTNFVDLGMQALIPGRLLPDYAAICSDAVFHGLIASTHDDAYALHIRVGRSNAPHKSRDPIRVHKWWSSVRTQRQASAGAR